MAAIVRAMPSGVVGPVDRPPCRRHLRRPGTAQFRQYRGGECLLRALQRRRQNARRVLREGGARVMVDLDATRGFVFCHILSYPMIVPQKGPLKDVPGKSRATLAAPSLPQLHLLEMSVHSVRSVLPHGITAYPPGRSVIRTVHNALRTSVRGNVSKPFHDCLPRHRSSSAITPACEPLARARAARAPWKRGGRCSDVGGHPHDFPSRPDCASYGHRSQSRQSRRP
jgi:hypothetical protein